MSTERIVRIGLTEAADIAAGDSKVARLPLSERVRRAKSELGFDAYEAMPTPATVFEVAISLPFLISKDRIQYAKRLTSIKAGVVNIHSPWVWDRLVYPLPSQKDSFKDWLFGRWAASLLVSSPVFISRAMRFLTQETGASVSFHWPQFKDKDLPGAAKWENQVRRRLQGTVDRLQAPLVLAEDHVLIGMNDDDFRQWLKEDQRRGLAFVSGPDVRDQEFQGKSPLNYRNFAQDSYGIYLKDGWTEEKLAADLGRVLEARPEGPVWILVNYARGANPAVAEKVGKIADSVLR